MLQQKGTLFLFHTLHQLFGERISIFLREGVVVVRLSSPQLLFFSRFLKYSTLFQFTKLQDLFCVDYPTRSDRFEVNYFFNSQFHNCSLLLQVGVSSSGSLPSLVSVYPNANWLEREVWDLFGVYFSGHPDLRRILTDYGFSGFPLRKDYPLVGFEEVRYDEQSKKVLSDPIEFAQEYRYFDFKSPW